MNLCRLCCVGLIGVILSLFGLFIFVIYDAGNFIRIDQLGLQKCKSVSTPKHGYPCEDVQGLSDGSMIISCGSLLEALQLFQPYTPYWGYTPISQRISKLSKSTTGDIYRITPQNEYQDPVPMKLKRYVHPDFHPHGMSVVKDGNWQGTKTRFTGG